MMVHRAGRCQCVDRNVALSQVLVGKYDQQFATSDSLLGAITNLLQSFFDLHGGYFDHPAIMAAVRDLYGLFDRARGRIVGSEQYLTKPFTKDELLGAISNQIN